MRRTSYPEMLSSPASKLFLIIVLILLALGVNLGTFSSLKKFDLVLGLDLAGGSHLVFEADVSKINPNDRKDALESTKNIIEQRVNFFGVSEPNVQTAGFEGKDRIIVELPGIKDTKLASDLIGKTAQLEFREFVKPDEATTEATLANTKPTGLTGADLAKASPSFNSSDGKPVVSFTIKSGESAKKFAETTTRLKGKPLAIFLDGVSVSSPIVQETITDQGQITGNFTTEGVKELAKLLNAGALPVPIKLIEERTVGATLGAESIQRSVKAGLVGLGMVALFMVLSYGRLGLVADVALIIFGIITLALYRIIPIVLTLPGIAGFLLSVGMAVDSNILIFERFKEERKIRDTANALEVSFGRAWDSIRDANIATLVTAFILANPFDWSFLHTSGPVRGFAITLALGIFISLFTGIVVSRNLLRVFIREKKK